MKRRSSASVQWARGSSVLSTANGHFPVSKRKQRGALRPQPADRPVDRLHPVHIERARDGRHKRRVVAGEEVAEKAAPDLHLEDLKFRSLEPHVPASAIQRYLRHPLPILSSGSSRLRRVWNTSCTGRFSTVQITWCRNKIVRRSSPSNKEGAAQRPPAPPQRSPTPLSRARQRPNGYRDAADVTWENPQWFGGSAS